MKFKLKPRGSYSSQPTVEIEEMEGGGTVVYCYLPPQTRETGFIWSFAHKLSLEELTYELIRELYQDNYDKFSQNNEIQELKDKIKFLER